MLHTMLAVLRPGRLESEVAAWAPGRATCWVPRMTASKPWWAPTKPTGRWTLMPPDKDMGIWRDVHITATGPFDLRIGRYMMLLRKRRPSKAMDSGLGARSRQIAAAEASSLCVYPKLSIVTQPL